MGAFLSPVPVSALAERLEPVALFTVFSIPIATAQNMGIFLFFRFITGLCGSGFLSVAGGR